MRPEGVAAGKPNEQEGSISRASLRDLLNDRRVHPPAYTPGEHRMVCPKCGGGSSGEKSFSLSIEPGGRKAVWNCFRANCGWTGGVDADRPGSRPKQPFLNDSGRARRLWHVRQWGGEGTLRRVCDGGAFAQTLVAGFAVSAMRKRTEEAPVRPRPNFDGELSQEVL